MLLRNKHYKLYKQKNYVMNYNFVLFFRCYQSFVRNKTRSKGEIETVRDLLQPPEEQPFRCHPVLLCWQLPDASNNVFPAADRRRQEIDRQEVVAQISRHSDDHAAADQHGRAVHRKGSNLPRLLSVFRLQKSLDRSGTNQPRNSAQSGGMHEVLHFEPGSATQELGRKLLHHPGASSSSCLWRIFLRISWNSVESAAHWWAVGWPEQHDHLQLEQPDSSPSSGFRQKHQL